MVRRGAPPGWPADPRLPPAAPVQEGWRCPTCGAVWAPFVPFCGNCRGSTTTITTTKEES